MLSGDWLISIHIVIKFRASSHYSILYEPKNASALVSTDLEHPFLNNPINSFNATYFSTISSYPSYYIKQSTKFFSISFNGPLKSFLYVFSSLNKARNIQIALTLTWGSGSFSNIKYTKCKNSISTPFRFFDTMTSFSILFIAVARCSTVQDFYKLNTIAFGMNPKAFLLAYFRSSFLNSSISQRV